MYKKIEYANLGSSIYDEPEFAFSPTKTETRSLKLADVDSPQVILPILVSREPEISFRMPLAHV